MKTYFTEAMGVVQREIRALSDYELDEELLRFYTLLALTTGQQTTLENVHDAWAAWRTHTKPAHENLVPFARLSARVAALDTPVRDGIWSAARKLTAQGLR